MGLDGSPSTHARVLPATEELERQHRISDAARIGCSYRHMAKLPALAFERRESRYYRSLRAPAALPRGPALRRRVASTSARRQARTAPCPVPRFNPSDYVDHDDIPMLAAKLDRAVAALTAGDSIPDLPETRRDVEKAEDWRCEKEM